MNKKRRVTKLSHIKGKAFFELKYFPKNSCKRIIYANYHINIQLLYNIIYNSNLTVYMNM